MATTAGDLVKPHGDQAPHAPDRYERLLSGAAILLLAAVLAAVMRGRSHWNEASPRIWVHLVTVTFAVGLTPVMLLRPRGDRLHRLLGRLWSASLFGTAIVSFGISMTNPGHFSLIHILSAWMLGLVPVIVWSARTHRIVLHRRAVRGAVTGALLVAGFFTFPFHRMLGGWLFG